MKTDFVCPKCRGALVGDLGVKRCASGHTYDRARAGYYNLLLGSGGDHGDNKMMVESRRAFLADGHYSPLADRISALVTAFALEAANRAKATGHDIESSAQPLTAAHFTPDTVAAVSTPDGSDTPTDREEREVHLPTTPTDKEGREAYVPTVLDCGCGEGYYTSRICSALDGALGTEGYSMLAFDISRDAARLAAKACKSASVAVASCYSIPVADGVIDVAMNVFSPLAPREIHRALTDGGLYIVAYPGEDHLFDLKAAIYDNPYKNQPESKAPDGFTLRSRERIFYEIDLDSNEKIKALFSMTPYAYRTGKKERDRLDDLAKLHTRVEFFIDVYEKRS